MPAYSELADFSRREFGAPRTKSRIFEKPLWCRAEPVGKVVRGDEVKVSQRSLKAIEFGQSLG